MSSISVSEGRICIINSKEVSTVKAGLEDIRSALIDFTTSQEAEGGLDSYILIDLSAFNIINSSIIGIFGSLVMNPKIQLLALCGVQPSVKEVLEKFGVINNGSASPQPLASDLQKNLQKVHLFDSTNDALISLNPR